MSKRVVVAILWFLAGWYVGAYVALFFGVSDVIGPILGVSAAVLFGADPLGVIWPRREAVAGLADAAADGVPDHLAEAA